MRRDRERLAGKERMKVGWGTAVARCQPDPPPQRKPRLAVGITASAGLRPQLAVLGSQSRVRCSVLHCLVTMNFVNVFEEGGWSCEDIEGEKRPQVKVQRTNVVHLTFCPTIR